MHGSTGWKIAVFLLAAALGFGLMVTEAILIGCSPQPFIVNGPGLFDNKPPSLEIIAPTQNFTRGQGDSFIIRWTDSDPDDVALVSFSMVNTQTNSVIPLVSGLEEDPITTGTFTASTKLIPPATYNILGTIDDGVNVPVNTFASTTGTASPQRVVATIVGEGEGPQTEPPIISVTEPRFNLSVSQDDILTVVVQPSDFFDPASDANSPFDPDSDLTLFILLDLDNNPTNDDPSDPVPSQIILLDQSTVTAGSFQPITFSKPIDLEVVKPRPNGEPYFIRATADDGTNPRVHQYAVGTINVVRLASGLVDLFDIGTTKAGVTFYGFNPGANVGSTVTTVEDFDADGVADFVMAAQFGNPRNVGPVGEAYLVYGQNQIRFGGKIGVNSISETVSGVIFEAPPIRSRVRTGKPRSDGITDVSFIRDLTNDGRPEILFGLAHVHGAFEGMDFDPADDDLETTTNTENVEVVLRQGEKRVTIGQEPPVVTTFYRGIEDVTISSIDPNISFGSSSEISWQDNGPGSREWALLKFKDILIELPDSAATIDVESVRATLELRIFDSGSDATLHLLTPLVDFNEQTTFNSFARNGGEPEAGVDYEVAPGAGLGGIGSITGGTAETVTVDISDEMKLLLDSVLSNVDDELRFILVPLSNATNRTSIRSSESNFEIDRPTIRINYPRRDVLGALGCYPDDLVNNKTDSDQQDQTDHQFTAGGIVVFFNSENRDNNPRPSDGTIPERLDTTSIALELVGQERGRLGRWILGPDDVDQQGNIFARADDYDEFDRIAGGRFMAGPFDFEDHRILKQKPREDLFGQNVASIRDLNNDGLDEIIISAPLNERHIEDLFREFGFQSTHWQSTLFKGSIIVIPGEDFNNILQREKNSDIDGSTSIPTLDQQIHRPFGNCTPPRRDRHLDGPVDIFEVFAEDIDDRLGGAQSAGDFNQDGIDDLLCGAYLNDRPGAIDSGAVYILYGRNILGDFDLKKSDDPILRAPMLRVRGLKNGDQIGWKQTTGLDVNGDRIDDVFISSPRTDFGGVSRSTCAADFDGDGLIDSNDLTLSAFSDCLRDFGNEVFTDDECKAFDYDNDGDIDADDNCVFCCLSSSCTPDNDCIFGKDTDTCCENLVDNGFVAVVFGGVFTDGDRDISRIGTPDLPGAIFFGSEAGHRAGMDVSSAGDFNQDGFGDILIAVPGETRCDREVPVGSTCEDVGRERLGVVYLIFGGLHLFQNMPENGWSLSDPDQGVGSDELPGIVFLSPFIKGRPNEAAPRTVAFLGDINNDGFGDIAIGNPEADFIDLSFPQGPNAPGSDAAVGRRRNSGHVYIVYGNNFGSNRQTPP